MRRSKTKTNSISDHEGGEWMKQGAGLGTDSLLPINLFSYRNSSLVSPQVQIVIFHKQM